MATNIPRNQFFTPSNQLLFDAFRCAAHKCSWPPWICNVPSGSGFASSFNACPACIRYGNQQRNGYSTETESLTGMVLFAPSAGGWLRIFPGTVRGNDIDRVYCHLMAHIITQSTSNNLYFHVMMLEKYTGISRPNSRAIASTHLPTY